MPNKFSKTCSEAKPRSPAEHFVLVVSDSSEDECNWEPDTDSVSGSDASSESSQDDEPIPVSNEELLQLGLINEDSGQREENDHSQAPVHNLIVESAEEKEDSDSIGRRIFLAESAPGQVYDANQVDGALLRVARILKTNKHEGYTEKKEPSGPERILKPSAHVEIRSSFAQVPECPAVINSSSWSYSPRPRSEWEASPNRSLEAPVSIEEAEESQIADDDKEKRDYDAKSNDRPSFHSGSPPQKVSPQQTRRELRKHLSADLRKLKRAEQNAKADLARIKKQIDAYNARDERENTWSICIFECLFEDFGEAAISDRYRFMQELLKKRLRQADYLAWNEMIQISRKMGDIEILMTSDSEKDGDEIEGSEEDDLTEGKFEGLRRVENEIRFRRELEEAFPGHRTLKKRVIKKLSDNMTLIVMYILMFSWFLLMFWLLPW